jgi:hypothetical protein
MKITKAEKRDRKSHKRKNGMRVNGKSLFTIQDILIKRKEK